MALNKSDKQILEEIIVSEGDCLDGKPRCSLCPFRAMCLPEFLNMIPPSKKQRFDMAMRVLTHHCIIDPDSDEDIVHEECDGIYKPPQK